ncbi:MAG: hypothetical protein CEE40_00965 [Chloroflexi bacterium B3_Chlor]|nr:MAG: hypothetical protein CEE40_00965 [Chloroflexi bacterium B3_Chlor]
MIRTRLKNAALCARAPIIICLLGLPASWPLWKSSLPRSFDGLFHLYRLLELRHLLGQGTLFPRWAPDLFFGYGYPIFEYVPALPYYLTEILHVLGLSLIQTLLLSFALSLLASGVAMYFFVEDIFGPKAGMLSAVAYMYAPFHLYDILFRGHLPGAWSMVLYPLVLWSFRRLIETGATRYFMAGTLLFAASILTHNPASLTFIPFLTFFVVVLISLKAQERASAATRTAIAVLVGAGLAAFFWVPALSHRQFVQLDRMITPPDLDYHTHFVSPGELLAPSPTADTGLMNPGVPNNLGPVFVSLSVVSVVGLWRHRRSHELVHLSISMVSLAVVVFMLLPQSAFVWENLPLLKYLVFPHRFLRLGSLVVAILCGTVARLFPDNNRTFSPSFAVTIISIAMIIVSTFSLLYPPLYRDLPLNPSFVHMMEFERRTGTIGTTSFGEYLPIWAEWIPSNSPLEPMYRSSATIERLDLASLPLGVRVTSAQYEPTSMTVRLATPGSFQATFNSLYFPGWQAYVDGQKTSITPTHGQGLISVLVPAGEHVVRLRFEDLPVHTLSKLITGLSAMVLVLLGLGPVLTPSLARLANSVFETRCTFARQKGRPDRVNGQQGVVLALIAITLLGLKVACIDRYATWFKKDFDGSQVAGAHTPLQVNFGDQITLLGYDPPSADLHPGDTLSLNLYWKARQSFTTDYSTFAHLADEEMNIYAQKDSLNPGRYPTRYWELDEYNKDPHQIVVPPGTPPGKYLLGVGLYNPVTLTRLPVIGQEQHQAGMYFLQDITIFKGDRPPSIEALGIQERVTMDFDNGMTLLGYTAERDHLIRGDFYRLALFWRARKPLDSNYSVAIRLLNQDDEVALDHSAEPSAGRYPTRLWEEGEIVRDNHSIWIGKDFPPSNYVLQLALLDSHEKKVPVTTAADAGVLDGWLELAAIGAGD